MSINSHSVRFLSIICIQRMNVGIMRRSQTFHRLSLWRFMNSWMSEWLIWFISCFLSVGGLESREMPSSHPFSAPALSAHGSQGSARLPFRQTDIDILKYTTHKTTKFGSKQKTWHGEKNPSSKTKVLMFYELVRLLYGPWRHHQPSRKSSLLCQMARPFSPATVQPQLFWASVVLGKLGKRTHNCAHIVSGGGDGKKRYQWRLRAPRTSRTYTESFRDRTEPPQLRGT